MRYYILLILLLSTSHWSQAQLDRHMNLRRFDERIFHFGASMGMTVSSFHHRLNADHYVSDSLVSLVVGKEPGFHIGFVSSLKVAKWLRLRFVPSLSFQERTFDYQFSEQGAVRHESQRLESVSADLPLLLKIRTLRIRNFAVSSIFGGQYSYDFQSQQHTQQNPFSPILKSKASDWSAQVGMGCETWLEYFKLGLELKLSFGVVDALVHDDTKYIAPMKAMYSKTWWISITFEA